VAIDYREKLRTFAKWKARSLLVEARAYVRREACSPTINLLDPPRGRENAALLKRIDFALKAKKRQLKEQP
jgi:hypothetical protein